MPKPVPTSQLELNLGESNGTEHLDRIIRHDRYAWHRFECSCGAQGVWRDVEDDAWKDADRHRAKVRRGKA